MVEHTFFKALRAPDALIVNIFLFAKTIYLFFIPPTTFPGTVQSLIANGIISDGASTKALIPLVEDARSAVDDCVDSTCAVPFASDDVGTGVITVILF